MRFFNSVTVPKNVKSGIFCVGAPKKKTAKHHFEKYPKIALNDGCKRLGFENQTLGWSATGIFLAN